MRLNFPRLRRWALILCSSLLVLAAAAWALVPWAVRWAVAGPASAALGRPLQIEQVRFNPLGWTLTLEGLQLDGASPAAEPLLRVRSLQVDLSALSLLRAAPVVESVRLVGPQIRLARTAAGHYDVDDLLERFLQPPASEPTAPAGMPRFALRELSIDEGEVDFDDQPLHHHHQIRRFRLSVPSVSTLSPEDLREPVRPRLSLLLNDALIDSEAALTPFDASLGEQLQVSLKDLSLASWADYLPASVPLLPTAGRLSVSLALRYAETDGRLQLDGRLGLEDLAVADRAGQSWLQLGSIRLDLDELDLGRHRLAVRSLGLDDLTLKIRRDAAGRWNALPGTSGSAEAPVAGGAAAKPSAAPSAQPSWTLELQQLSGQHWTVQVDDAGLPQSARWQLAVPEIRLERLRWPLDPTAPATQLSLGLELKDARGQPTGHGALQTTVKADGGEARLTLDDLAIGAWQPYLATVLTPSLQGVVSTELVARWPGAPGAQLPQLSLPRLSVAQFRLSPSAGVARASATRPVEASWRVLTLSDLQVDLAARLVTAGSLVWDGPQLWAERDAAGELNISRWAVVPPSPTAPVAATASSVAPSGPGWRVRLAQFQLSDGTIRWRDAAAGPEPVAMDVNGVRLSARHLTWPQKAADRVPVAGELRLTAPGAPSDQAGRVSWAGQGGLTPASWNGRVQVHQLPAHLAAAYLTGGATPVSLEHGLLSSRLDGWVQWLPSGPRVALEGEVRLDELQLNSRLEHDAAAADLLRWQSLGLEKIQVALEPDQTPHVELGQVTLDNFFARLVVSPEGQLNLRSLGGSSQPDPVPVSGPVAQKDPALPEGPPAGAVATGLDLVVGGVQLRGGRVDFADRFIRPNYRTDLSELNGRLGPFRSTSAEPATLSLSGKAAGTAALSIQGSVLPTAKPLALDIQARASDLELAPLTPYAAKYAGYVIERGKLTLDVNYRIQPDGRLQASNQLILNQLTFGDRVDSPDATQLPVTLAVALLKDRHGVIDLNLPISGSLNEPEFSVGRLVLQVLGNLLSKAVTAPFALLMGGDADELRWVDFVPGTAEFGPAASAGLDQVARRLQDRPALRLTVAGAADPQSEREALQAAQLEQRLIAAWRRQRLTSAGSNARMSPAAESEADDPQAWSGAPEAERLQALTQVYADTSLPDKPRNLLGLAKSLPAAQMQQRLQAAVRVTEDMARDLALRRGIAVRDALIARGLPNARLFLAAPRLRASDESDEAWKPRVELKLAAD